MPIGIVMQQITKAEDLQLLFEEISPQRANTFQVFYRIGKYGRLDNRNIYSKLNDFPSP
jgi:hypothetical protein